MRTKYALKLTTVALLSLSAAPTFAEQLAPDPLALPSSGIQHPATIAIPVLPSGAPKELDLKRDIVQDFGNANWGGGYRVYEHARAPAPSFQSINFDYYARARMFGKELEGFRVHGATWNPRDDFRASRTRVVFAGQEIFSDLKENEAQFGETKVAINKLPFDKVLYSVNKTFTLGPIPVNVKGTVRAEVGVNVATGAYRKTATTSGVSLDGTAFAKLYGSMSAGAGTSFASAGISGQVTLAELRVGKNITVDRKAAKRVDYNNSFRVVIGSLDGSLNLYASLFAATYEKKILDWDGVRLERDIAKQSGSINFL